MYHMCPLITSCILSAWTPPWVKYIFINPNFVTPKGIPPNLALSGFPHIWLSVCHIRLNIQLVLKFNIPKIQTPTLSHFPRWYFQFQWRVPLLPTCPSKKSIYHPWFLFLHSFSKHLIDITPKEYCRIKKD